MLLQTLDALAASGITPILIKGSALAYSLYADPALRTRGDTDLIIPAASKEQAQSVLARLGYHAHDGVRGEFVSYQASFTRIAGDSSSHTLDLHWKINNAQALARLFDYEELRARAQALPRLGPRGWGPSRVDALLIACMHRATHRQNPYYVDGHAHHDANRLIWLYDIDLLARALDPPEWHALCRLAEIKGLRGVCLDGLRQAATWFQTPCPGFAETALARPGPQEPPSIYLGAGRLRQQWMDISALDTAYERYRYLRELIAPPADYMLRKYGGQPRSWLPWLYVRRALAGVMKKTR